MTITPIDLVLFGMICFSLGMLFCILVAIAK